MFEKLELTRMAQSLASHSGARLGVIAKNIAHADTPGFKAQDLGPFATLYEQGAAMRATRNGHFGAEFTMAKAESFASVGAKSPNGNSVSLELEMVKAAETRQDHEMALAIYRASSSVIRSSLGRS